jgi:hypothetical protein
LLATITHQGFMIARIEGFSFYERKTFDTKKKYSCVARDRVKRLIESSVKATHAL